MMKMIIAGAGAMGSRFGGALYQHGQDVTLVDNWVEHVEKINEHGLCITNEQGKTVLKVPASLPEHFSGKADLIVLFTKSADTARMMKQCVHLLTDQTAVLTLQNGLGNIETISRFVQEDRLFAGVTTYAANIIAPAAVEAFGSGHTEIMHISGRHEKEAAFIASMLSDAGIQTTISKDVIKSIWHKAAFNAVLNPLCTLTQSPVAVVGGYEKIHEVIDGVLQEFADVAEKKHISFDRKAVKQTINSVLDPNMSGHHYSSMYHDIKKGRPTEIDYLNGAIVKIAEKQGISVPYNKLLFHLIKMIEMKKSDY